MTTHIALLRGINVGGHRKIGMADLRNFLSTLGFTEPRTLLQTGNLVFGGKAAPAGATLERLLETEAEARLALVTEFFVRSRAELVEVIASNPFPAAAKADPAHLLVMFFKHPVSEEAAAALQASIRDRELVRAAGREAYLVYPDGGGPSRLTGAAIERALGGRGTARNWNTVLKLAALAGA